MRIRDLSPDDLRGGLRGPGLKVSIGPFVFQFFSDLPQIVESLGCLYADFHVPDVEFVDFLYGVHRVARWKRIIRDSVNVTAEGMQLFEQVSRSSAVAFWEWGINRCVALHSQQYLMLHAGVVERDGHALIIVGDSGAGKSTLCAGLTLAGWRLLSDEFAMTPVTTDGSSGVNLKGLAQPIALKNESIDVVRRLATEAVIGPLSPHTVKGAVAHLKPDQRSVDQVHEPAAPLAIVFVNYQSGKRAHLDPVTKGEAMYRLGWNSFNFGITGRKGFETLATIVDESEAFDLTYSDMDEVKELIEHTFDAIAVSKHSCAQ